jgi:hypothetical protein
MRGDVGCPVWREVVASMERKVMGIADLAGAARAAVGAGRRLLDVQRLEGGSKKGVYRLSFDDGFSVVIYIWDAGENYWPATGVHEGHDLRDPFSEASGFDMFDAARRRLDALGILTPRVYLADRSHIHYPADIAVVEDLRGGTLESLLEVEPQSARAALEELGDVVNRMHHHQAPHFGKISLLDHDGLSDGATCAQVVMARALHDLTEVATREARIANVQHQLKDVADRLLAGVQSRSNYGLIHGELGPDHVMLTVTGQPVLIDIEGLMFFDVEWEHVFLQLRFGHHYRWFKSDGLDDNRMRFYRLAMHLSLVAGPLRLLDGDYPRRDFMQQIVEHSLHEVLGYVR